MFTDQRLDLGITYGTVSTLQFKTSILETGDGGEQRIINWTQPLLRFQVGDRSISNENQNDLSYLQSFFTARQGSYQGFRFKDWADYSARDQYLGTGTGYRSEFQLYKSYYIGNLFVSRPIFKPVPGTVRVYVNGIEQIGGWSVDYSRGVVIFDTNPNNNVPLKVDFEFDVPVRFEQDKINLLFEGIEPGSGRKIYKLSSLTLVEIKFPDTLPLYLSTFPTSLNHTIDLGYDTGTVGGLTFSTLISTAGAGFEKRSANWNAPKGSWEIGDRTLDKGELDYLICLFRLCRGRGIGFTYFDHSAAIDRPVRFGEDSLGFRFDALSPDGQKIFYLSGLNLQKLN